MARVSRKVSLDELAADLINVFDRLVRDQETVIVEKEGRDLAIVTPIGSAEPAAGKKAWRLPGAEEVARSREGILKAAGSWRDVDVEAFKADLWERRRASSRLPIHL